MVILTPDTKTCMSALLLTDSFDPYSFIEGEITTFAVFKVDGYLKKEFFEEAPSRAYSLWQDVRGYFLSIIKGKRTPLNFRLIFALSAGDTEVFLREEHLDFSPEEIQGLFLNFRFDGDRLTCTTGVSTSRFPLDKSLEHAWDKRAQALFDHLHIPFEIQM